MKKLLTLILVLALSGVAAASMDIYITDTSNHNEVGGLVESDYLELVIWYTTTDSTLLSGFDLEVGSSDVLVGTLAMPVLTAENRQTVYDYVGPAFSEGMQWEICGATLAAPWLTAGIAKPLATVLFHCEGAGDVTLSMLNVFCVTGGVTEVVPTYHSMVIHQVPEPATIALLCLGGLLLRKKK